VRVAREEGCDSVTHSAASKGNDQIRMETAIAALNPHLQVLAPVRQWNLRTAEDKLNYAHRRRLPIEEPQARSLTIDRNLWGASVPLDNPPDSWQEPPADIYTVSRAPEDAPDQARILTIGFKAGLPCSLGETPMDLLPLVRELNQLGGQHAIGRSDVLEDRLFGIKSREIYEVPA